jgi:hypothetical protein
VPSVFREASGPWLGEKLLALLSAGACLVVTVYVWQFVASQQLMWPLPALYLIEMLGLSAVAAAAAIYGVSARWVLLWIAAGALLAFSVLAMFSIGIFYLPIAGLFAVTAILSTWRSRRNPLISVAWAIGAATVQVIVIFAVISVR